MKEGIVVHLGANDGNSAVYRKRAKELGRTLAIMAIPLIYGGSKDGCMGALADGCMELGGTVIGVMPRYIEWKQERVHTGISELIEVDSMAERKRVMTELSFAGIAMPGAYGTLDEMFEYLTSSQLSNVMFDTDYKIRKVRPFGLLDVDGYFINLIRFLDNSCVDAGFLTKANRDLLKYSNDPAELISMLLLSTDHKQIKEQTSINDVPQYC